MPQDLETFEREITCEYELHDRQIAWKQAVSQMEAQGKDWRDHKGEFYRMCRRNLKGEH